MSDFLKHLKQSNIDFKAQAVSNASAAPIGDNVRENRQAAESGANWRFAFATGIECSNPVITGKDGRNIRRDQLAECGHYESFKEDFELTRELGLKHLRYGLAYHLVNPARGKYDWSFAEEAMHEIKCFGIVPILDLLHFGVPDWLGDFQNAELPVRFAEYAGAVARRYPWVRAYTPVNEIYIAARASAKDGVWNERLKTDTGFVTALKHLAAANILVTKAIARTHPSSGRQNRLAKALPENFCRKFIHRFSTSETLKDFIFRQVPLMKKIARRAIEKVLSKVPSVKLADKPTEAQFFILYRETRNGSGMRVKYLKNHKRVVVWAEERKTKESETELTEAFLDVLQRNKKLEEEGKPTADAE